MRNQTRIGVSPNQLEPEPAPICRQDSQAAARTGSKARSRGRAYLSYRNLHVLRGFFNKGNRSESVAAAPAQTTTNARPDVPLPATQALPPASASAQPAGSAQAPGCGSAAPSSGGKMVEPALPPAPIRSAGEPLRANAAIQKAKLI
jgi:hypothetical protein